MDSLNSPLASIIISADKHADFVNLINKNLKEPPPWLDQKVQKYVLKYLPQEIKAKSYTYSPKVTINNVTIDFTCTHNQYRLKLQHNTSNSVEHIFSKKRSTQKPKTSPVSTKTNEEKRNRYKGPLTKAKAKELPKDLQQHGKKLAQSDFPYTLEETEDAIIVGGKYEMVGEVVNLSDLLKKEKKGKS